MNFSARGITLPLRAALDLNYFNQYPTYHKKNMSVLKSENPSQKMGRGGGGVMKTRARELKSSDKVRSKTLSAQPRPLPASESINLYFSRVLYSLLRTMQCLVMGEIINQKKTLSD